MSHETLLDKQAKTAMKVWHARWKRCTSLKQAAYFIFIENFAQHQEAVILELLHLLWREL